MTSEVKERLRHVTDGYVRRGSQYVKQKTLILWFAFELVLEKPRQLTKFAS